MICSEMNILFQNALSRVVKFLCWLAKVTMVLTQRSKWMYAIAGSGVVLGIFNYFQPEKTAVKNSWTTNFEPSVKWNHNWDNRDASAGDKERLKDSDSKAPIAKRHIFMIRHGQYNMKAKSDAERKLTELGRKQAELVGQRLKDLKFNYTKMIRSTMTRAIETSDIIHKCFPKLPIESCDLLREGAPIQPDPPSNNWKFDDEQYRKDGERIEKAFKTHFHRADVNQESDSYEIMVCHANVIRYFICRLLQFPPEAWLRFQLHHCSITWVVIMPSGRVGVYGIGDSGFFDYDHMTG
ncbi:serine/threonine-protein phosphatase PGAM5, mitochondrial [Parasteatoda tepidariorum]|uniref:serine/threonine-protein phosphatase PGAM5, mitochondrial n=1 Tax=Parasteatoda tepidariorum TaxID=114398 RepID=UPI001C7206C9|nr:serine/threonine-protein phosphatase PGAM5, mitochondrial isoform X2 [Parasteatoda tepidariorum]